MSERCWSQSCYRCALQRNAEARSPNRSPSSISHLACSEEKGVGRIGAHGGGVISERINNIWRQRGTEHNNKGEQRQKGDRQGREMTSQNGLQTSTGKVAAMHGGACFRNAPIKQTVFESTSYGYPQAAFSSRKGRSRRPPPLRVRALVPWQQPWQGQRQRHPWQRQRVRRRQQHHRRGRKTAWSCLHAALTWDGGQQICKRKGSKDKMKETKRNISNLQQQL